MELRDFLDNEGAGRLNVVAVNWMEDNYGTSDARLKRFLDVIHPSIPVVEGTEETGEVFGGAGYVPVTYIFNANGELVSGDGSRSPVDIDRLRTLLGPSG